jgi:hypothetical protein
MDKCNSKQIFMSRLKISIVVRLLITFNHITLWSVIFNFILSKSMTPTRFKTSLMNVGITPVGKTE